ncbi:hypothetical protein H0H93_016174 [Arthromyces matolae]|nr:hypothetical protein H0H93_016174 [Arthromyces matolae]
METRNLQLRILYTVSGSQYILARSSSAVTVNIVPPSLVASNQETHLHFGTTSLKACLNAICTSSPELVQDKRRDFSVYVLDPLESNSAPARVNIPNATSDSGNVPEQPRGLAVALGLMSWALMLDEKDIALVTGTIIKLPTGQEALEVIFALKETVAMEKSSLPQALRSWGLPFEQASLSSTPASSSSAGPSTPISTISNTANPPTHLPFTASASMPPSMPPSTYPSGIPTDSATVATITSIQLRSQQQRAKAKPKRPARTSSIDPVNSEADRLLLSHCVGPERRKGRPPNASSSKAKSSSSNPGATSNQRVSLAPLESRMPDHSNYTHHLAPDTTSQHESKMLPRPPREAPTNPLTSTPLIRSPKDPESQGLLDILAFISSSPSSSDPNVQNSALLSALGAIDSSHAKGHPAGAHNPPGPMLINALRDLIAAAAAQRLPTPIPTSNNTLLTANNYNRNHPTDDDIVVLDKENVNPTIFRRRCEREGKSLTPSASALQPNVETPAARSLSTRSNGNNITPVPSSPPTVPQASGSSGVRRKRRLSDIMDEREASRDKGKQRERQWIERRDIHRLAHSSPRRNELRHYPRLLSDSVQPPRKAKGSYYRTGEIWTSPRASEITDENSQQEPINIEDSPKAPKVSASSPIRPKVRRPYVVPAWARTSTSTQPRLSEETVRAIELAEAQKQEERKARKKAAFRTEKDHKKKRVATTPSPSAARQRNSTIEVGQPCPPVTVASNGPMFAVTSAIQDRIAAFSGSTSTAPSSPRLGGNLAPPCTPPRQHTSDLFSPCEDGSLFTPMPKRGFLSARTPMTPGSAKRVSPKTPKTLKKTVHDGNEASGEESEDDLNDALNRELGHALEELDIPSTSLPAVSSDIEMDTDTVSEQEKDIASKEDPDVEISARQPWIGLPPSSPPPPTSPLIMPQDDESDDTMLPAVTSDCPTDSEFQSDSVYSNEPSSCIEEDVFQSELSSIFEPAAGESLRFGHDSTMAGMDLFDQFININSQSENTEQNHGSDPDFDLLQAGLVDLDFTGFWETFKPLLGDQNGTVGVGEGENLTHGQIGENQAFDFRDLDHTKLAEDVQALFSGSTTSPSDEGSSAGSPGNPPMEVASQKSFDLQTLSAGNKRFQASRTGLNETLGERAFNCPGDVFQTPVGSTIANLNLANQFTVTDSNSFASVTYAVRDLRVEHIVVLGHYGCQSVHTAMTPSFREGILKTLLHPVSDIFGQSKRPEIRNLIMARRFHDDSGIMLAEHDALRALVEENVKATVKNLQTQSILSAANPDLQFNVFVHGLVLDEESGEVTNLDVSFGPPGQSIPNLLLKLNKGPVIQNSFGRFDPKAKKLAPTTTSDPR